jgi:DNA-nicking Smr family endonuclease
VWRQVAATVTPLEPVRKSAPAISAQLQTLEPVAKAPVPTPAKPIVAPHKLVRSSGPPRNEDRHGLDSSWERRIARGGLQPDFSLDLHGSGLDQAYGRLMHGLAQARAMDARVVLIVTGKPRPTEAADRGHVRGAIRAKIVDWLGASEHAGAIAAIRAAHRRHGGPGALYVVLKRRR